MAQLPVQQAFDLGRRYHQSRRLREAEQIYRQILAQQPAHADALHLLGVIAYQMGRHGACVDLIRQAIALKPAFPEAYSNLGNALKDQGQLDEAIAAYRQAIALKPDFADAHYNLGMALEGAGLLDEAIGAYRQAIALVPGFAKAQCNLGIALKEKGQLEEAMAAYRRAIGLRPDYAETHYNLGIALKELGQLDEAVAAYRRAIALKPDFTDAHYKLGLALKDAGVLDEAIGACRQAIALNPHPPEAHNDLGDALSGKGLFDEAIAEYTKMIQYRPDDSVAHLNLGNALSEKGRLAEALLAHRRAVALGPGDPRMHGALGGTLLRMGDVSAAEASVRQALALKPDSASLWNSLGAALTCLGQFTEASECFRRALTISPDARFYWGLLSTGRQVADAAEVARLTELVKNPGLAVDDRIAAEFGLGKLHDEAGCFDAAFEHFAAGNHLFKESRAAAGERFDGDGLRRLVDRTIEDFTQPLFADRPRGGEASEVPVFIVGMPRSGTSLVEQIAASHPAVFGAGELGKIQELSGSLLGGRHRATGQDPGGACARVWDAGSIATAANSYLELLHALGGGVMRVIDKMPGNVFHLGLIAVLFPGARVIFCRRNAQDTCLSCYFARFYKNNLLYAYDLADCGRQYLETERLTAHWRQTLPLRMHEIQYEALVADQEEQSRRVIDFLGLAWDSACLEFHRTKRPVLTASAWQVRQPIYTQSVGRWRHYERHLGPLLEVLEGAKQGRS